MVYREIGLYHGFENLDSYPLTWKGPTARAEVTSRYEDAKHLIVSLTNTSNQRGFGIET